MTIKPYVIKHTTTIETVESDGAIWLQTKPRHGNLLL